MKKLSELLNKKRCAVVSNSGSLLDKSYGELIDSHDVIIRSNRTVINGYEKFVGSRTDIRLLNNHCTDQILNKSFSLNGPYKNIFSEWDTVTLDDVIFDEVIILTHSNHVPSLKSVRNKLPNANEVYDSLKFIPNIYIESSKRLTTGGNSIALASNLFEEVNCFCFDFMQNISDSDSKSKTKKLHYFEESNWKPGNQWHNFKKEKNYLSELQNVNWFN